MNQDNSMKEVKLTVVDRKVLVKRMEELTGLKSRFQPGRLCSYQIDRYTATKNGTLLIPEDADYEMLRMLYCEHLIENPDTTDAADAPDTADELRRKLNGITAEDFIEPPCEHETEEMPEDEPEEPNENSIFLPLENHTGLSLRNLVKILFIRSRLIEKSTGARIIIAEPFIRYLKDDRFTFSTANFLKAVRNYNVASMMGIIFTDTHAVITAEQTKTDGAHRQAFIDLISCINETALKNRQVRVHRVDDSNEKFVMRIWLDSIGLTSTNYKKSRKLLMEPLTGICAYKTKAQLDAGWQRYKQRREKNE